MLKFFTLALAAAATTEELTQPPKTLAADQYEIFSLEQLSTGALLGQSIRPEAIAELVTPEMRGVLQEALPVRVRPGNVKNWDTSLLIEDDRLDGFSNFAVSFIESKRSEGSFRVKLSRPRSFSWYDDDDDEDEDEEDATPQIEISQLGLQGKDVPIASLTSAITLLQDAYKEAIDDYIARRGAKNLGPPGAASRKSSLSKFQNPSISIYEFRKDWVCGQAKVTYRPLQQGFARTEKYINFRVPVAFVKVHLLNPDIDQSALHQKIHGTFGQVEIVSASGKWRAVSTEAGKLTMVGLDRQPTEFDGAYMMGRLKDASLNMTTGGCSQAAIISREGYSDHCVHTGDQLTHHYRSTAAPPDIFALKCVGTYPTGTLVVSTRYKIVNDNGNTFTEVLPVVNECQRNGVWTEDIILNFEKAPKVLESCRLHRVREVKAAQFRALVSESVLQRVVYREAPAPARPAQPPALPTRPAPKALPTSPPARPVARPIHILPGRPAQHW